MFPFTLQQLRSLQAIETENSFTKAASILRTSQPTLSKKLIILEKNFNLLFIKRTNKNDKIDLTEKGKVLVKYSDRILGLCEESCRIITDLKNKDRGSLTIGVSQVSNIDFLSKILLLFTLYFPQLNIQIKLKPVLKLHNELEQKQIDLAIIGGQIPMDFSRYINKNYLLKEELNLIVPKEHLFLKKKRLMKKDIYTLDFIVFNSISSVQKFGKVNTFLTLNHIHVSDLNILLQLKSIQGVKTAVSLGLGAAFITLPVFNNEKKLNLIKIIRITDFRIIKTIYVLNNSQNYKSKIFEIISQKNKFRFSEL